jgi:hypothetical protein
MLRLIGSRKGSPICFLCLVSKMVTAHTAHTALHSRLRSTPRAKNMGRRVLVQVVGPVLNWPKIRVIETSGHSLILR